MALGGCSLASRCQKVTPVTHGAAGPHPGVQCCRGLGLSAHYPACLEREHPMGVPGVGQAEDKVYDGPERCYWP